MYFDVLCVQESNVLKYNLGKVEILFSQIIAMNSKAKIIPMIYLQPKIQVYLERNFFLSSFHITIQYIYKGC